MEATLAPETYTVGQTFLCKQTIDDKLVRAFAEVSGDRNPIHLDDAVAAKSRFGQRIAHGAILCALISKVLGMDMPGVGTVYLGQTCSFKLPVFLGDTVQAGSEDHRAAAQEHRPDLHGDHQADR